MKEKRDPAEIQFLKNEKFEYVIGLLDVQIPTKQDKFKRLILNLYLRKRDNLHEFRTKLQNAIKKDPAKIRFETECLEVVVGITAKQKRLNTVDIDNLTKSVLDCLNGIIFKDDKQVQSVLAQKFCIEGRDSVFIGVRKMNSIEDSLFKVTLFNVS